jgi:hypothetical protein
MQPSPLLLAADDPAVNTLARDLDRARKASYTLTFEVCRLGAPVAEPEEALDALAADLEFRTLGPYWIEIPRRIALKLLTQLIASELAYPEEVVSAAEAAELAARFVALFPASARYFTNGAVSGETAIYDVDGNEVVGWRSLSEADLDNGVIAFSDTMVGMIWAEDSP